MEYKKTNKYNEDQYQQLKQIQESKSYKQFTPDILSIKNYRNNNNIKNGNNEKNEKKVEEQQQKLSLKDNLERISNLYKASSQPRLEKKELKPNPYFYNVNQQITQKNETKQAIKENQNIKTFLNENVLQLKDYDLKQFNKVFNKATAITPNGKGFDFGVKSPLTENRITRAESQLNVKKYDQKPIPTFLKGAY